MLRIHRAAQDGHVVFSLSGRIKEEHVAGLKELLGKEKEGCSIAFDLEEVRLVHREVVRFFAACEARGIKLENCPAFVREWIQTGSDTSHESNSTATSKPN